jgi:hypothetical protein
MTVGAHNIALLYLAENGRPSAVGKEIGDVGALVVARMIEL